MTCRGSNEISSYQLDFLRQQDKKGVSEVNLFSDDCVGQNKNTITHTQPLTCILTHLVVFYVIHTKSDSVTESGE